MTDAATIRQASSADIEEMIAIDVDACTLYADAGLDADLGPEHPYAIAERACWTRCAGAGNAFLAAWANGPPVGLLVLDRVDGAPYVEQISVRRAAMGQGMGRRLLDLAIRWAGRESLWLTTYAHIPWNRPFYERHGFVTIAEADCPPGIVTLLEDQRRALPAPVERIAMCRRVD